jgi:nicotinamidase-related amidase
MSLRSGSRPPAEAPITRILYTAVTERLRRQDVASTQLFKRKFTTGAGALSEASLPYGPLGRGTVHLCVDMQTVFAERTDWHVPWLEKILPRVLRIARAHAAATIFTRFVPPATVEDASGSWRRFYQRWPQMTRQQLDLDLVALLPSFGELVPPAEVIDKQHYSPFSEPAMHRRLQQRQVDTLVITGAETDVCVLGTVLGAVDLGYRVIVVADAVCSVSDATHDALMLLYHQRFGQQIEVASTETVLAEWA